jgi:WhiB family transcriptional regulator, redox-sensing transcriptional regulator
MRTPVDPRNRIGALCIDADPRLFFPERGDSTREAKAICARCPHQAPCLEYALAEGVKYGIWGGTSENQRRDMRRRRAAQEVAA